MILTFSINNNDEPKPYYKPTLILLLFTPLSVTAQYDNPNTTRSGPSPLWMGILLGIATFLVVIMFIILNLFCKTDIWNQAEDRPVTVQRASKGLDPSVVESFPAFKYSDVAAHRAHLGPLECAVCLSPFEHEEKLRLLPKCNHVFHVECLDPWLKGQSTCPLCRVDLVPETGELDRVDLSPIDDPGGVVNAGGDDANNDVEFVRGDVEEGHIVKYKRWKSTGHVAEFGGMEGESWTKFTVMLPEKEIKKFGELNMKLKRTRSSF